MTCDAHKTLTITKPYCVFCMENEISALKRRVQFYSTSHIGGLSIDQLSEFAKDLEEDMRRMDIMLTEVEELIQVKKEEVPHENNPNPG